MYPKVSKYLSFLFALLFLAACKPNLSSREPSLTQVALLSSMEKAQQSQDMIYQEVATGNQYIAAIEDTSNGNRSLILTLDTVFKIRYSRKKAEWIQSSEQGLKVSHDFQQEVQDHHSRLRASAWKESTDDRINVEEREQQLIEQIQKMRTEIIATAHELRDLSASMDTIPVPKPAIQAVQYTPQPVLLPPPAPEPDQYHPSEGPIDPSG